MELLETAFMIWAWSMLGIILFCILVSILTDIIMLVAYMLQAFVWVLAIFGAACHFMRKLGRALKPLLCRLAGHGQDIGHAKACQTNQ